MRQSLCRSIFLVFLPALSALAVSACTIIDTTTTTGDGGNPQNDSGTTDGSSQNDGGNNSSPELKSLSAGSEFTCAVVVDGTVRCWGRNNAGQLGNGTKSNENQARPVKVVGLTDAIAVSAGVEYACALKSGGTVVCWGGGALGVLGNGATDDVTQPTPVSNLTGVTEIAAGYSATCALKSDGTVWCWGRGGDYGVTNFAQANEPVQVTGLSGITHIANANEGGTSLASLVCAIKSDKTLLCFSNQNVDGQLGTGDKNASRTPIAVPGINDAVAVTASLVHACAVRADGTYCWGASQLVGDGSVNVALSPVKISPTLFAELSSGFEHTCARDPAGDVWCWGSNNRGQSGDGQTIKVSDYRLTPTKSLATGVTIVSAGMFHNCVYTKAKKTLCWGANNYGELGSGTPALSERVPTPTEVVW